MYMRSNNAYQVRRSAGQESRWTSVAKRGFIISELYIAPCASVGTTTSVRFSSHSYSEADESVYSLSTLQSAIE
jgi:hypothetical protein